MNRRQQALETLTDVMHERAILNLLRQEVPLPWGEVAKRLNLELGSGGLLIDLLQAKKVKRAPGSFRDESRYELAVN
jgi:hypothetical protein